MANGELILYQSDDGLARVQLRAFDGSVWLTQTEVAELFDTSRQNVATHLKNLFVHELTEEAVSKENLLTASDGKAYLTRLYNLEAILAVGFRVRSRRGTQFRQWATTRLREYLVKGFVIDEVRLKDPEPFDYFDELLEKIREIRASEKRFYQKIKDVYTTSADYDGASDRAQTFFKTVQNKMLFAVTGNTAAALVLARADQAKANMGLTSWKGSVVRKADVTTAKNYLSKDEMRELNRIVTMFLDVAEDRAERRRAMTMADWESELDRFLRYNEREVLEGAGRVSHDRMEKVAGERYAVFDGARRANALAASEAEHVRELKSIEKMASKRKPPPT